MDSPAALQFETPLFLPPRGGSTRVQLGSHELILESVRGGHSLLWLDGRQARRFALGLCSDGRLALQLRAPRLPVFVASRDVLVIVPGGRLRGYLQVPLIPTIVWWAAHAADSTARSTLVELVELPTNELESEWDEQQGARYRCTSPWHVRFPMRSGDARAIVPVVLRNTGEQVLSPGHLPLQLRDDELLPRRGSLVIAPRRMSWTGSALSERSHEAMQVSQ